MGKLTLREAARLIGLGKNTLRGAIKAGRLSATRTGGRYQIDPAKLIEYQAPQFCKLCLEPLTPRRISFCSNGCAKEAERRYRQTLEYKNKDSARLHRRYVEMRAADLAVQKLLGNQMVRSSLDRRGRAHERYVRMKAAYDVVSELLLYEPA